MDVALPYPEADPLHRERQGSLRFEACRQSRIMQPTLVSQSLKEMLRLSSVGPVMASTDCEETAPPISWNPILWRIC